MHRRQRRRRNADLLLNAILIAFAVAVPLVFTSSGNDSFGIPKELLLRAEAILLLGSALIAALFSRLSYKPFTYRDPAVVIAAGAIGWAMVATLCSTSRQASLPSLLTVLSAAIIFLVALGIDEGERSLFHMMFVPALINAILCILQEFHIWNPFQDAPQGSAHIGTSGLIGNPNLVGTYLVAPSMAALAAAIVTSGRRRWTYSAIATALIAGLVTSLTLTAAIALSVGVLALVLLQSRRIATVGTAAIIVVGIATVTLLPQANRRMHLMVAEARAGGYQALSSNRLTSFMAATEMVKRHPLTGVGPGRFSYEYFDYKGQVENKYPALLKGDNKSRGNFGEVHDDYLQTAAETGLPGLALLLAALVILGRASFAPSSDEEPDESARLGRVLAFPLAAAFAVVAIAQFPLQTAAPRLAFLMYAALALKWSRR